MTTSRSAASANGATVAAEDGESLAARPAHERSKADRTAAEQEYLEARADDAEDAVKKVKRMIDDLEKSLKDREAEAKTARAHARGRVED